MESLILFLAILGFEYDISNSSLKNAEIAYVQNLKKDVSYNGEIVTLFRFEKNNTFTYNDERISAIVSKNGTLLGYAIFNAKDIIRNQSQLPTKKQSEEIAKKFIQEVAPDLTENMNILWIEPHEELIIYNNKQSTITGMKVKCRDLRTGLYFWVIVGADKQIMAFERNIKWIVFPGKRGTEKWLDDNWVMHNDPF